MSAVATRTTRRLTGIVLWIALGAAVGVALAAAGPYVLGGRSFTVMSGSMEPGIHTGDVVVDETIHPRQARVGDVITFPDSAHRSRLITHRLHSVRRRGNTLSVETKGDANNSVERWRVPADGHIGRVVYRLPMLGYAVARASSSYGRLVLFALLVGVIGAVVLARVWRTAPEAEVQS